MPELKRPFGPALTLHGRLQKPGAKEPWVSAPPPKAPPRPALLTLRLWDEARRAGDLVAAGKILNELRELATRPKMREDLHHRGAGK